MHERNKRPTFSPGIYQQTLYQSGEITDLPEFRRFTGLPRLDFMDYYNVGDFQTMKRISEYLRRNGGALEEVGRGEDMIAYSRPELNFVIKFPYNDNTGQPTPFNYRVSYGYSLAKEYLGGIFAPSIDVYGVFTDRNGQEHAVITLIQQKVKTVREVLKELSSRDSPDEAAKIKQAFIQVNQRMWEIGILDCDSNWEENYGLLPDGALVLIDVGWLSDDQTQFSFFEGIPRIRQYEGAIRDNFTDENFKQFFGTRPLTRKRSADPRIN